MKLLPFVHAPSSLDRSPHSNECGSVEASITASDGSDISELSALFLLEGYVARIVVERQWHPTEAIRNIKPDGSVIEFQADLAWLEEITRWVLSWGSKAQVIGPPELVSRVAEEVEGMREKSAVMPPCGA